MFNAYLLKGFKYWLKPVKRLKWGELYNQDGSTHELPNSEIEIYDGNLAPRDSNEIPVSKDEDQEAPEVQGIYEVREEPKKLLQVESV